MGGLNNMDINKLIKQISPVPKNHIEAIQNQFNNLTKPLGSLGILEKFVIKLGCIQNTCSPKIQKKRVYVFAADHGIAEENVSAYPASVTPQMVLNFLNNGAAINVLTKHFNSEITVVDVGVNFDFERDSKLINKKIAKGTKNFLREPAMSKEEALKSLEIGFECAKQAYEDKIDIIVAGEMGIANTSSSSAITSLICNLSVSEVTGRGTGISDNTLKNKINIIKEAIQKRAPNINNPLDILMKVGGFEIGAIAGLALGCAYYKIALVTDGFISTTGIALANKFCPYVKQYIFPSHSSVEQGHISLLKTLDMKPIFDFEMRLGEGTGGIFTLPVLESAIDLFNDMSTFEKANVDNKLY